MINGLTLLALRLILAVTAGGFGLILLTAGSTEWEIRSEAGPGPDPPYQQRTRPVSIWTKSLDA